MRGGFEGLEDALGEGLVIPGEAEVSAHEVGGAEGDDEEGGERVQGSGFGVQGRGGEWSVGGVEVFGDGAEGAVAADDDGGFGLGVAEGVGGEVVGAVEEGVDAVTAASEVIVQEQGDAAASASAGDRIGEEKNVVHDGISLSLGRPCGESHTAPEAGREARSADQGQCINTSMTPRCQAAG